MCPDGKDLIARQMALLKQLEGRGVARASDHFARQEADAPAGGAERSIPRPRPLDAFFPEVERVAAECGGSCCRVISEATTCGRRTRQGYACPSDPFGGPPRPAELAALTGDPRWAEVDPARILYLDTETTGLTTSTGTYTFLIGLGRFAAPGRFAAQNTGESAAPDASARFIVEQYFMEDYGDEAAVVEVVDRAFAEAQALVSYNGRTFDVPLLETRWRLQRRRLRLPELHLDLLHYARRLWRLRLPNCSLGTVEHQILDITRMSDVDGSWVPRIYFDFTRGLRPERIVPVFDHHAQDIYSLGALAAAVLRAWNEPEDPRFAHAGDQWGLARLYETRHRMDDAIARMEAAVLAARDEDLGFRLAMHLARTYKRRGRPDDAVAIWESRVAQATATRLDPLVELAKHAEHALKDYALARRWVERALALIQDHAELAWLTSSLTEPGASTNNNDAHGDAAGTEDHSALTRQIAALTRRRERIDGRKAKAEKKPAAKRRRKTGADGPKAEVD